jgi:glycerol-3-phosphate dehydrogenase
MHELGGRMKASKCFDLLVIGGGITGCGIALDAAARGLSVALVEQSAFGSGTSSRSTKLIHGGLRYLAQGDVKLVMEVGRERAILHRNAPHLVLPEKMLLPIVRGGSFKRWSAYIGLAVYDRIARVISSERKTYLSKHQACAHEPLLPPAITKGAFRYAEYRTDDARLTIAVAKSAEKLGAELANYTAAESLLYDENDRICGARCSNVLSGKALEIQARTVVNAAGPWVDQVRQKDGKVSGKRLHHTKGVHLVVDRTAFPVREALYFDVFDGRMLFAIPRGHSTYFGTTDTNYLGDPSDVHVSADDVDYLLTAVRRMFPQVQLQRKDVRSSWAGIRPLIHEPGKGPSEISRKDEIFVSDRGLISIAGGKLTGFRKMAERTTDRVMQCLHELDGRPFNACTTAGITLDGGDFAPGSNRPASPQQLAGQLEKNGLSAFHAGQLVHNFGTHAEQIAQNARDTRDTIAPLTALLLSELRYALVHESLQRLEDFYVLHTGRLYFEIDSILPSLEQAAAVMAEDLNWDAQRTENEIQAVRTRVAAATTFETT